MPETFYQAVCTECEVAGSTSDGAWRKTPRQSEGHARIDRDVHNKRHDENPARVREFESEAVGCAPADEPPVAGGDDD